MTRHYNLACVQCRTSKKRCDGPLLNSRERSSADLLQVLDLSKSTFYKEEQSILPCTYCQKTQKTCSLHPKWVIHEFQSLLRGDASTSSASSRVSRDFRISKKPKNDSYLDKKPAFTATKFDAITRSPMVNHVSSSADSDNLNLSSDNTTYSLVSSENCATGESNNSVWSQTSERSLRPLSDLPFTEQDETSASSYKSFSSLNNSVSPASESSMFHVDYAQSMSWPEDDSQINGPNSVGIEPFGSRLSINHRKRKHSFESNSYLLSLLSPFGTASAIAVTSQNQAVVRSLLQIYHEVVENNLTCWITTDTCPYGLPETKDAVTQIQACESDNEASAWGASWPDRMYRRVIQLDRTAQNSLFYLTQTENRACLRALELSIMAFAAQWAQGSQRHRRFPSMPCESVSAELGGLDEELAQEFERSFQSTLWQQAKRAIQEVRDIECFRVVYAEFLFGLTQKPEASYTDGAVRPHFDHEKISIEDLKISLVVETAHIFGKDNQSGYLEMAVRKMHGLKYRLEGRDMGIMKGAGSLPSSSLSLSSQERQAVGFLYWLLVMHDTVCSPINERPVVLSDEHCQTDVSKQRHTTEPAGKVAHMPYRWTLDAFLRDDPNAPQSPRWPCTYRLAAKTLIQSAPVKILLYRQLSYLQNALRAPYKHQVIQNALQGITSAFRYWERTYHPFFRDLVKSYTSLPSRFKVWFVCIHVAWNLGIMILADLLEFIEHKGLMNKRTQWGQSSMGSAEMLRKNAASELCELAAVTSPTETLLATYDSDYQLPGYHFAVSESPLLTEPCTPILIKAFVKSTTYYLSQASDLWQQERLSPVAIIQKHEFEKSIAQSEACLRALWCLGKKSEVAKELADVALQVLYKLKLREYQYESD